MKKVLKFVIFLLICAGFAFAQENSENPESEELTLPDVSTVIYGGALKVGKSAIPDYSEILPKDAEITEDFKIELPEGENQNIQNQTASVMQEPKEKSIFANGVFGAGFPGHFLGDFTIYRQTKNPFKINFLHESSLSYAFKSVNDGFFDRNTEVSGEKELNLKNVRFNFSGFYKNLSDGMQSKSLVLSDVTKNNLGANVDFLWQIKNGFYLDLDLGGQWYNRFANLVGEDSVKDAILSYLKKVSVLTLNPSFDFGWKNDSFKVGLNGNYLLESDLDSSFENEKNLNRAQFLLDFSWKSSLVKLFLKSGIVFGNVQNDSGLSFPFEASTDFTFKTPLSTRNVILSASGGLKSKTFLASELEQKYKFASLCDLPGETSDWFAHLNFSLPIKNAFSLLCEGTFYKTAFENGRFEPNYNADSSIINSNFASQYIFNKSDLTQFNTIFGFSLKAGIFTMNTYFSSFWLDVPALEYKNSLGTSVSLQSENSKVGLDARVLFNFDENYDRVPILDFSAFLRVTSAIRLAINADDIVKLISQTSRVYAGEYIQRGGRVSLVVKFNF